MASSPENLGVDGHGAGPDDASLASFQEPLRRWFSETFSGATPAQRGAWPAIADGRNTLLLAPTGSGKTLAAFLVAIDRLMFGADAKELGQGTKILYLSPLKALGVDVQRNLRSPLAGVRVVAERIGQAAPMPSVGIRSGDTPAAERRRMLRQPPDILITTPESLYLMMTSQARESLASVNTVIVDEIHSLVAGKRGAHLFVTLERLEDLRRRSGQSSGSLQRIGLSATQRPLEEVARLLGGAEATADPDRPVAMRPVEIVEAGRRKSIEVTIEVPVEDMARLADLEEPSGPAAGAPVSASIWAAIHPRLVELIRSHRSTMIFVNSRRLAERLATAINELAEEDLALAHHGSIAKDTRAQIEDRLKAGDLPAIVATSSLELGIDMGAVDLVIQIEAPPSIASGLQRIGRAGHQVGALSSGVVFPKYRGDLLACSAAVERMLAGEVEETFFPRNPLDVLAQQIVASVALEPRGIDELYAMLRGAAPFFDLPRSAFENTMDLLAGRYPSDEFAELKPRVTWDRIKGEVAPRRGAQRLAVANAGTIPDRGLYGVYLAEGENGKASRVGELDEEMVFETRPGDVFLLGASAWRALEITPDRVIVAPAPGESGRMPFWRGESPGRPLEFGRAIGKLARDLVAMEPGEAHAKLMEDHGLELQAAKNLIRYLQDQVEATIEVPSDRTIIIESFLDEIGDWRIAVLSPFGGRVHAPWATAIAARIRADRDVEVDLMWGDDGMVFRLPESDSPPDTEVFFPPSEEIEQLVVDGLGSTALFAARFRENAGRALLLPKRRPGGRTPLWLQRRRSSDLLQVASKYESFPILLETYRECLRDVFDIKGLKDILRGAEERSLRVRRLETSKPSPFAGALTFGYTANFLYEGDIPLAERRAATLALDHALLREILGDAELRELLDAGVIEDLEIELQRRDGVYPVKHADGLHDLLLTLGDLSREEIVLRAMGGEDDPEPPVDAWIDELLSARRAMAIRVAGELRYAAAEEASRFRDALGVVPPPGLPSVFLEESGRPMVDLVSRFARTHAPFRAEDIVRRLGAPLARVDDALKKLALEGRILNGEFTPSRRGREWCDQGVLKVLKRRSLAKLRREIEAVEPEAFGRFLLHWQGLKRKRVGLDGLLDVVEQLQGAPIAMSVLEEEVLPARVESYRPGQLDELFAAGELAWQGRSALGTTDGRIAIYLKDQVGLLAPSASPAEGEVETKIIALLQERGASFFDDIKQELAIFPEDVIDALWRLVWKGLVSNDTLQPLRSLGREGRRQKRRRSHRSGASAFRSRRQAAKPGTEGRWSLFLDESLRPSATERQAALTTQLIERYGILTRELVLSEGIDGGFSGIYPILRAMEESGRLRRGYFVAGQGGAQFALAGADDHLRAERRSDEAFEAVLLATTDPANPYGAALAWPPGFADKGRPQRAAGAKVLIAEGRAIAFISAGGRKLLSNLPEDEATRTKSLRAIAKALAGLATRRGSLTLETIDGQSARQWPGADELVECGFHPTPEGLVHRGGLDRAASRHR